MKESSKITGSMGWKRNSTQKESWLEKEYFQKKYLYNTSE